ncbi:MAG TPA: DegV family protein, partial [Actinomycetes bacterium]|nr:DegV family protein [Actinomycetes bacterium]
MTKVAVVTDSTSYLPAALVVQNGIEVVPLQVVIGGTAHDEGGRTSSETVAEALRSWTPVSTSRPGPAAFA